MFGELICRPVSDWLCVFWDNDRMRTPPHRAKARFTIDETMIEFIRRVGYPMTLENKTIVDGDAAAQGRRDQSEFTDEPYRKLCNR